MKMMRLLKVVLRVLVAILLALALLVTWAWWYYRPTLERTGTVDRPFSFELLTSLVHPPVHIVGAAA